MNNNTLLAVQLLATILQQAQSYAELIRKAQMEGRDVSSDELDQLHNSYLLARQDLQKAIDSL